MIKNLYLAIEQLLLAITDEQPQPQHIFKHCDLWNRQVHKLLPNSHFLTCILFQFDVLCIVFVNNRLNATLLVCGVGKSEEIKMTEVSVLAYNKNTTTVLWNAKLMRRKNGGLNHFVIELI